ncbi:MAG TPA: ABC transporter permease subunit [Anaerolineales bacterium]|nr:ABC transporter permease subunit [Anaerolineales bacterium]
MNGKRSNIFAIFWGMAALLYFFVPLYGTFDFSLRMERGVLGFKAYELVFADPRFWQGFRYSFTMAIITIVISVSIFVPTVYWMYLKIPKARPIMDVITILPFIIPGIVLVFGLIRTFSRPPFQLTLRSWTTDILMVAGYIIISMPYMFRAIDVGMRSIDVRTLTEAAQSLGSSWFEVLKDIIIPNLRLAILGGALISFATVMGELILADFLVRPALGPYMVRIGLTKAYEPAALAIISYAMTWFSLGLLQFFSGRSERQKQFVIEE